ncbi:LapA family protein [Kitasatospora sp. NPDC085879]|uniref:LapA family protein n=1 Tax=Kitasatospora sp. NPDC085879 TaxID=3154769 RepID=UPI003422453D
MTKTSGGSSGRTSGGGKPRGDIAGVPTRVIAVAVIVVLAIWFLFANLEDVKIQFWVFTVTAPLWIALLGTLLAGGALGWLLKGRRTR